jgi:hypothetical protein
MRDRKFSQEEYVEDGDEKSRDTYIHTCSGLNVSIAFGNSVMTKKSAATLALSAAVAARIVVLMYILEVIHTTDKTIPWSVPRTHMCTHGIAGYKFHPLPAAPPAPPKQVYYCGNLSQSLIRFDFNAVPSSWCCVP